MNLSKYIEIAAMFLVPFLVVYIPIVLGQRYGIFRSKQSSDLQQAPVGAVIGAAFGLLGFMLALTFLISVNRYSDRKDLLLEEVTNIRTTYRQAGLMAGQRQLKEMQLNPI